MEGLLFITGMILGGLFGGFYMKNLIENKHYEEGCEFNRKVQIWLNKQYKLGFEQGLKSKRKDKWISVYDQLPGNEYIDCMIVCKVGDKYEIDNGGWTEGVSYGKNGERIVSWGWWTGNDWDEGQGCIVQYWMPYPELPEDIKEKLVKGYDHAPV